MNGGWRESENQGEVGRGEFSEFIAREILARMWVDVDNTIAVVWGDIWTEFV